MENSATLQWVKGLVNTETIVTHRINRALKETGLSLHEMHLLGLLNNSENYALLASEISSMMYVQKSVTTHRVKTLEALGAVVRHPVASDRRRTIIVLTAKGRRAYEIAKHVAETETRKIQTHLSKTAIDTLASLNNVTENLT